MSDSERSGEYPENSNTPMPSDDAAELEELRREAAVLREQPKQTGRPGTS